SSTTASGPATSAATHGLLELALVHPRAALDALPPGLVVELVLGPSSAPGVRATAAPLGCGELVLGGAPARLLALAGAGALLVDGASRDLLRGVLAATSVLQAFLDVLV